MNDLHFEVESQIQIVVVFFNIIVSWLSSKHLWFNAQFVTVRKKPYASMSGGKLVEIQKLVQP